MKIATTLMLTMVLAALPAAAVDFLGVELCKGSTDTAVKIPFESSLVLESVEIGDNGGLVMLLSARSGKVMKHVDDLMTGLTGNRGQGDGDSLEWTGGPLSGVAQRVAKKYAALAVASTDECSGSDPVPAPAAAPQPIDVESVMQTPDPVPAAAAAVVAASQGPQPETGAVAETETVPESVAETETETAAVAVPVAVAAAAAATEFEAAAAAQVDFGLVGALSHEAAGQPWVDVMGVVANHTATGYKLATFDLSFFAADGSLICVDTISVSVLKTGQERAFRDAIRCPGYDHDEVAEIRLQFAGGL